MSKYILCAGYRDPSPNVYKHVDNWPQGERWKVNRYGSKNVLLNAVV